MDITKDWWMCKDKIDGTDLYKIVIMCHILDIRVQDMNEDLLYLEEYPYIGLFAEGASNNGPELSRWGSINWLEDSPVIGLAAKEIITLLEEAIKKQENERNTNSKRNRC